jgi:hypothetical protein
MLIVIGGLVPGVASLVGFLIEPPDDHDGYDG